MRAALLVWLVATLLVAAGCGGDSTTAASGTGSGAAALAPADATVFVSLNTDAGSDQVEQLRELAQRFPIARDGLDRLVRELAGSDLSWEEDVDPAVGSEVAVVVLAGGKTGVALTQPDDGAKLDALVERADADLTTRDVDGWRAIGEPADLDAFEAARSGETLADNEVYADAFDDLPGDALAKVFVRGAGLEQLGREFGAAASGVGSFEAAAFVVEATDDGLRLDGRATGVEGAPDSYEPRLLGRVPENAFLAVSFGGLDDALSSLRSANLPFLPELERGLGVTLDELGALLDGEGVLYARSGVGIPEVTLVLEPEDRERALATLRKLAGSLAGLTGGSVERAELDGVQVEYVSVQGVRIQFAAVDDAVIVTSGVSGIRDYRADGGRLTDTDAFEEAADDAGFGDSTNGVLYLDFEQALPVIEGLAVLAGEELPREVRENLEPLASLFLHGNADDGELRFGGVLTTR